MCRSLALLFSTLLLLTACAVEPHVPSSNQGLAPSGQGASHEESLSPESAVLIEPNIRIERNENAVVYRGSLTEEGLTALQITGADPMVDTLVIESTGGEIVVGMDFGIWVVNRDLDVVVDHACLSSCANYVFTAGRNKKILPGAVVAWHGSAKQPGLLEQLHQMVTEQIDARELSPRVRQRELAQAQQANVRYLTDAIFKQDQFFFRLGIDEYVTRIGNERYGVRGLFYLSVSDMAAFGIDNVSAPEDYAAMDPQALAGRVGLPVTLVRLE